VTTEVRPPGDGGTTTVSDPAYTAWSLMCDLVLNNERRREASEALGMSFGRIKAIRRLARAPMALWELASTLGIDAPYATVVVDDLEAQGLVRRRPHPSDRRAKLVEVTRKGKDMARRADKILGTPPPALASLGPAEVTALVEVLQVIADQTHD
jgi:DNA-binding MarR family transcriptional regulator